MSTDTRVCYSAIVDGTPGTIEVELDSRHRLPMGRVVSAGQHRFRVTPLAGGDFLVSPVVSVSERELAVLRSPERLASLQEGLDQAAKGDVVRYGAGHFTKLAEEIGPDDED